MQDGLLWIENVLYPVDYPRIDLQGFQNKQFPLQVQTLQVFRRKAVVSSVTLHWFGNSSFRVARVNSIDGGTLPPPSYPSIPPDDQTKYSDPESETQTLKKGTGKLVAQADTS